MGDIWPTSDPYNSNRWCPSSSSPGDPLPPGVMVSPSGTLRASLSRESISTGTAISPGSCGCSGTPPLSNPGVVTADVVCVSEYGPTAGAGPK